MRNLRLMRNILFKTWLIGVAFTLILWAYAMTDMIRYFMWALPGYTIESANALIMHLAIIVDVSGVILFLAPTLALCWQIASEKRKEAMAEIELAKLKAQIFGDADQFAIANRPAKKKAQKTARPAAKKAKAKKRK